MGLFYGCMGVTILYLEYKKITNVTLKRIGIHKFTTRYHFD